MSTQDTPHSHLDDVDENGVVTITLPSHVPHEILADAIDQITATDFGLRATYAVEGHRIAVTCEPMAFVDSAIEHLVDVVRAMLTDKFRPRPIEGPVDDGMPF